jgi:hypothetical protein
MNDEKLCECCSERAAVNGVLCAECAYQCGSPSQAELDARLGAAVRAAARRFSNDLAQAIEEIREHAEDTDDLALELMLRDISDALEKEQANV